jgi:hypothetical protein
LKFFSTDFYKYAAPMALEQAGFESDATVINTFEQVSNTMGSQRD